MAARRATAMVMLGTAGAAALAAQATPAAPEAARERAEYVAWLTTAPTSPLAAIAQQPIGTGLRLGPPDADVPLEGVAEQRVTQQGGTVTLAAPGGRRPIGRGIPIRLADYTLTADGPPGRAVLTVFGPRHRGKPPLYYEQQSSLVFIGDLTPPETRGTVRVPYARAAMAWASMARGRADTAAVNRASPEGPLTRAMTCGSALTLEARAR